MKVLRKLIIRPADIRQGDMIFMDGGGLKKANSDAFELAPHVIAVETEGLLLQIKDEYTVTVHRTVEYDDDDRVM